MDAPRDTDEDWRRIASDQPYWGVLTEPQYRTEVLTPEVLEAFYETGRKDVVMFADLIRRASDEEVRGGRALDFGCGVGRLTEAMAEIADEVVGVDVAAGMLERARARGGRATYAGAVPAGAFDWINSHIVFQHIPPERGMAILGDLMGRLARNGAVSLQVPFSRAGFRRIGNTDPAGVMQMYDYDLNAVFALLWEHGVRRTLLRPTDHDGHYGFIVAGRRTFA